MLPCRGLSGEVPDVSAALTLALVAIQPTPDAAGGLDINWPSGRPDVNNPALGEIREFNVTGGTGATVELGDAAGQAPNTVPQPRWQRRRGTAPRDQRLGRARFKAGTDGGTWMVVMANAAVAGGMDPDAVLTAAFTPLLRRAGADRLPHRWHWRRRRALGLGWQPRRSRPGIPGLGRTHHRFVHRLDRIPGDGRTLGWNRVHQVRATKLMFDFKADGTVTVERSANGRSQTLKGTWGTNGDKMRLQVPGGGEAIPFTVSATSAGFPFEDAKVNLKKQ